LSGTPATIRPRVTHEWARLRQVVVGRPHYRLPNPMPESNRHAVSEDLWRKVKRQEGRTMQEAMPTTWARCRAQMDDVVKLLRARGVRVHRIPPFRSSEEDCHGENVPESMLFFPRDPLLVVGARVLELTARDVARRRERFPLRRLLRRVLTDGLARVTAMPMADPCGGAGDGGAFLDGGDCLVAGGTIYVGVARDRVDDAGVVWLRRVLGRRRTVETVSCLEAIHLDCALCLVRPGLGLFCPELIGEPPASLARWTWIEVSRKEAVVGLATNGLHLDARTLVLPEGVERVADALRARGHEVETVPFDAVTALVGGLRCWSQPLQRWG
jgi:glycine amidinotransferase